MTSTVAGPDRAWIPAHSQESDYFSYEPTLTIAESESRRGVIPAEFPASIASPLAWSGAEFKNDSWRQRCSIRLSEAQVLELELAGQNFQALGLPFEYISQATFPLPTLGDNLKILATELTHGVGFFHICGLDPRRYSSEMNVILFIVHLTDLGPAAAPENERQAPYSNVAQPFHTDTGDIIALYSLGEAECGGESRLASTATVFNEIATMRPDIVRLLSSPSWIFDRFGQWPPYTIRPILYPIRDENVLLSFSRRPLLGSASSPRSRGIPDLSASHVEAINVLHFVAERHALSIKLKAGEFLFWNNLALLHCRKGFTDSVDHRRHLIRLWLRNGETEKHWPIPPELRASWKDAFDHAGRAQLWPIEPIKERDYISNQRRSSGHG